MDPNFYFAKLVSSNQHKVRFVIDLGNYRSSNAPVNTISFIILWREGGEVKVFELFMLLIQGQNYASYLMNLLTVYSALTDRRCDNKLPHKKEPSKLPSALINCGKISFNLGLILVSGNWAHALDPVLQTKTSVLPNTCHLIKIK